MGDYTGQLKPGNDGATPPWRRNARNRLMAVKLPHQAGLIGGTVSTVN
jgi:hypothetical protein